MHAGKLTNVLGTNETFIVSHNLLIVPIHRGKRDELWDILCSRAY